jgi:anthranilate phosphoribosyltransferase
MVVFKGEGGEIERRPEKPVEVQSLHQGAKSDEDWPAMAGIDRAPSHESVMDLSRLKALWRGEIKDAYAEAVVVGTAAIALNLMGRAKRPDEAEAEARRLWAARPAEILPRSAARAA